MKIPLSEKTIKWLKTTLIAVIGGGLAAALAAAFDPQKYNIAHDFGSGKLWDFFLEGAGMTFVALLIKSPFGQQTLGAFKDTQTQLQANRDLLQDTKADLKASVAPPPVPPAASPVTGPPLPSGPPQPPSGPAGSSGAAKKG